MSMLAMMAPAGQSGSNGMLLVIVQFALIGGIFWFLIMRPQRQMQKKHQAMLEAVKKGDEVMTEGGIIGEVIFVKDDRLTIRTAESTRIVVARGKIARVLTTDGVSTTETK